MLSFSLPGKQEAFEVAEGELIPYRGPRGLPAKNWIHAINFHTDFISLLAPHPPTPHFGSFLCQSLCIVFFLPSLPHSL